MNKRKLEYSDDESVSENEPLPPVPQAPRHFTESESRQQSPRDMLNTQNEHTEQNGQNEQDDQADAPEEGQVSPEPPQQETTRKFYGCSPLSDYLVTKTIGKGTFGEVSLATHVRTRQKVALKKILIHNEKEGIPVTALREIRILKALKHANIIGLQEIAYQKGDRSRRERGVISMVFPYMDHDLTGLLENPMVRFRPGHIKSYMHQLLSGTAFLHKSHILHRDMKCSNILLDNQGNLKIADFGLARTWTDNDKGKYTNMVVTRWYRPPELLMGAISYTTAIDVWGVGCVFGEMLKRRPILPGSSDVDQLNKIFLLCGTPSEQNWPSFKKLPSIVDQTIALPFPEIHQRAIRSKFSSSHFHRTTVDLLDTLLELDPDRRPTAEQALKHDYFRIKPKAARPGTSDFETFPTSHELGAREGKKEEHAHIPNHHDAYIEDLPSPRRQGHSRKSSYSRSGSRRSSPDRRR